MEEAIKETPYSAINNQQAEINFWGGFCYMLGFVYVKIPYKYLTLKSDYV